MSQKSTLKLKVKKSTVEKPQDEVVKLDHRSHVYKLPDTYIGSIEKSTEEHYVKDEESGLFEKQTVEFPVIPEGKTWEFGNPGGLTTMTDKERWDFVRTKVEGNPSRCDWVNNCGPASGIKGVWQGVSKICNMSDPAQQTV